MLLSSGIETLGNLGAAFGIEALLAFAVAILFSYVHDAFKFRQAHRRDAAVAGELPPVYPVLVPYLGTAVPFLLDCSRFLPRATCYAGKLTSVRLSFFVGRQIFFFQDRETIRSIWKQSGLLSAINIRLYAYKFLFGLPEKWLGVYKADDSGPHPKPFPGSDVPPQNRIHLALHQGIHQALIGPGFAPTLQRFMKAFVAKTEELGLPPADGNDGSSGSSSSSKWIEIADMRRFFQTSMTASFVQAIFGPSLLLLNPDFVDNLVDFDAWAPWLGKGVPRILIPRAYAVRQRLRDQLKRWYTYARQNFRDESIGADGDGDPFWGSNWMRQRQKTLSRFGDDDDDIIASSDLGVAWASVGNLVPCALMAAVHIFEDPALLQRVRDELREMVGDEPDLLATDPKRLTSSALLSSIYAETLRLHVKTYTVVSSPMADMTFGRWRFPRNSLGLVNSGVCHLDADFWNTRAGRHPVDAFWADRFLVDPADPSSGPVRPERRDRQVAEKTSTSSTSGKPHFSMDGLEGSWLPYGGGHLVCPGRFLAKSAILFVCAVLVSGFDVEFLAGPVRCSSDKFGIGVEEPKDAVPFRIRRRA